MANPFEKIFKPDTPLEADRKARMKADKAEAEKIDKSLKEKGAAEKAKAEAESKRIKTNKSSSDAAKKQIIAEKKAELKTEASFANKETKARAEADVAENEKNEAIKNARDAKDAYDFAERNAQDFENKRIDAEREAAAKQAEAERAAKEAEKLAIEKAKAQKEVEERAAEHQEALEKEAAASSQADKKAARREVGVKKAGLDAASIDLRDITARETAALTLAQNKQGEFENASRNLEEIKEKEEGAKEIKDKASKNVAKTAKQETAAIAEANKTARELRDIENTNRARAEEKERIDLAKKLSEESIYSFESFKARKTGVFGGTEKERQNKEREYAVANLGVPETATNAEIQEALRKEFELESKEIEASKQRDLNNPNFNALEGNVSSLADLKNQEQVRNIVLNDFIAKYGLDPDATYPEAMERYRQETLKDLHDEYRKKGDFSTTFKKDIPLNEIFDIAEENQLDIDKKNLLKKQADTAQAEQEALTAPLDPLTGELKTEVEAMTGNMAKQAEKELVQEEIEKAKRQRYAPEKKLTDEEAAAIAKSRWQQMFASKEDKNLAGLEIERAKEKLARFQAEKLLDSIGETGEGSVEILLADIRLKLLRAYPGLPKDISFEEIYRRNNLDPKNPEYIDINKIKNLPETEGGVESELKAAEGGRQSPDIASSASEALGGEKTEAKKEEPKPAEKAAAAHGKAPAGHGHGHGPSTGPVLPDFEEIEYEYEFDDPSADFEKFVRETFDKFNTKEFKKEFAELKIDPNTGKAKDLAEFFMQTKNEKLKNLRGEMLKGGTLKLDGTMSHEEVAKAFLREIEKPGGSKYDPTIGFFGRIAERITGGKSKAKGVTRAARKVLSGAEKQTQVSLTEAVRKNEDKLLKDPNADMNEVFKAAINQVGKKQGIPADNLRSAAKAADLVVNKNL